MNFTHESRQTTGIILTDVYNIPHNIHSPVVHEFYREIEKYMKHKDVYIYGSVKKFFDQIFPYVVKYSMNDGTTLDMTEQQHNCLRELRQDISPQPFGYSVYNISHSLKEAMDVARSYMEVLSLIVEAINTTDHLAISEKCKEQTTQLQYCSHCEGHVDVLPCKGFCLNVMHQCLAQLSTLTKQWEPLLQYVVQPSGGGSRSMEIERLLEVLDRYIDQAIMHAVNNVHRYSQSVSREFVK